MLGEENCNGVTYCPPAPLEWWGKEVKCKVDISDIPEKNESRFAIHRDHQNVDWLMIEGIGAGKFPASDLQKYKFSESLPWWEIAYPSVLCRPFKIGLLTFSGFSWEWCQE